MSQIFKIIFLFKEKGIQAGRYILIYNLIYIKFVLTFYTFFLQSKNHNKLLLINLYPIYRFSLSFKILAIMNA